MEELDQKMNAIVGKGVVDRHSYFQLQYFVIGKEPTNQAKLRRCTLEIKARQESIAALELEIEETKDSIAEAELRETPGSSPSQLAVIAAGRVKRRLKSLRSTLATLESKLVYIREEAAFFVRSYEAIAEVEKPLPFDDYKSQSDYWEQKLSNDLTLRSLLGQPLDLELVKTILALDRRSALKQRVETLLEQVESKVKVSLPEPAPRELEN